MISLADNPKPQLASRNLIAWHGWRFAIRPRWAPVKIDGDAANGALLIADLASPKLVVRWRRLSRKTDPAKAVIRTLREDIGQLAADEAKPHTPPGGAFSDGLLYRDPEPPGRDVWIGFSPATNRLVSLSYHAKRRDQVLGDELLPTLADTDPAGPQEWSVFELSLRLPRALPLVSHRLNAGDLGLTFSQKRTTLTVRQIGPASVALSRMPLEKWAQTQESKIAKHFRPRGSFAPVTIEADERQLEGVSRASRRRRRYSWVWWFAKGWTTYAVTDSARDRIVVVQSTDDALARDVITAVGQTSVESTPG